jgi:hypothetical protein
MKKSNPTPEENRPASKKEAAKELSQEKEALTDEEMEKVGGGVISPRDPASGLPTGKRIHKPF